MSETDGSKLPYAELRINPSLSLRQLRIAESEALYNLIENDRAYLGEHMPWVDTIQSPDDTKKFIEENIDKRQAGTTFGYGIFVDDALVGHASLMNLDGSEEPEVGYWIAGHMAGQGLTTKVAQALVDLGLTKLNLTHLLLLANEKNVASNRIAEKLGAKIIRHEANKRAGAGLSNVWEITNE